MADSPRPAGEVAGGRRSRAGLTPRLTLRLAWRNLWRNGRRTAISLAAVAFATLILVFGVAMQEGGYGAMIASAVGVFTGDLQVQVRGYRERPRLEETIGDATALEARVARLPGVEAVAARGEAYALVSSPRRSYGAQVVGVEPRRERRVSSLAGTLRSGRYLSSGSAEEAVIGATLAKNLHLALGDELTVLGQGKDGSLAVAACKVVGIFSSGSPELDRQMVEIPLGAFRRAFALGDEAHALVVRTRGLDALPEVHREVAAVLSSLASRASRASRADRSGESGAAGSSGGDRLVALDWSDLEPGLQQGIALDAAVGWFLYGVLVVVVGFSILNTFIMAVLERTRELGVLLALGARSGFLGRMLAAESLLLLLLGLALGVALGAAVSAYFGVHGIAFSSSEELLAHWNLPARIHPRLDLRALTVGPLAVLVATAAAALFPVLRVRRLRPVDAMRTV
jgi:ABC-type lipoprotein release transport system permease subunit